MRPAPRRAARFPWLACFGLSALGLALRLWQIGAEALFYDEYMTPDTAMTPGFLQFLRHIWSAEPHPPLFFLIMRPWIAAFGESPASLRLPAALFGVATVWALMRLVHEMRGGRPAVVLAGFLAAAHPFLVYYGQEARPYSQQVFLFVLNAIYVARVWRSRDGMRPRDLAGVVATATLAVLTHYHSIFLLVFDFWAITLRPGAGRASRLGRAPLAAMAWLTLLGIAVAWHGSRVSSETGWIGWIPAWTWHFPWYQWRALCEGPLSIVCPNSMLIRALAGWLGVFLLCGPDGWRALRRWAGFLGLMWLCLLVLPHALSAIHPLVLYGHRYMIVAMPALIATTALAAARARRWRALACALCLALYLAPAGLYLFDYYTDIQKRPWHLAAQAAQAMLREDDVVWYHAPFGDGPLLHYFAPGSMHVLVARRLDRFAAAPPRARLIALVSQDPAALEHPPPPGFRVGPEKSWLPRRPQQGLYMRLFVHTAP